MKNKVRAPKRSLHNYMVSYMLGGARVKFYVSASKRPTAIAMAIEQGADPEVEKNIQLLNR